MPTPKVYEFSRYFGALCVAKGTDVYKLGLKLGIEPSDLLALLNGRTVPSKAIVAGLTKRTWQRVVGRTGSRVRDVGMENRMSW
jgi:hypothetical protein